MLAPVSKLRCDVCNVSENPHPSAGGSAGGFGGMNKPPQGKWACEKCTVHNPDAFVLLRCVRARPVPTLPACASDRSPLPPLIPNKSSVLFYFVAIAAKGKAGVGSVGGS